MQQKVLFDSFNCFHSTYEQQTEHGDGGIKVNLTWRDSKSSQHRLSIVLQTHFSNLLKLNWMADGWSMIYSYIVSCQAFYCYNLMLTTYLQLCRKQQSLSTDIITRGGALCSRTITITSFESFSYKNNQFQLGRVTIVFCWEPLRSIFFSVNFLYMCGHYKSLRADNCILQKGHW
jgi:hypothetical protein